MFSRTQYFHTVCAILCAFMHLLPLQSQNWQLDPEVAPEVTITGTSSLHDWTVSTADIQELPKKLTFDTNTGSTIDQFGFAVLVESMDGGRGASMNTKIYDAFDAATHPSVKYQQHQPALVSKSSDGVYNITSEGTLSMAGTEKSVTVNCTGTMENSVLVIKGNKELNMSDFGMTPPSAMFGQIKTNDKVVVNFEFRYIANNE